jgi:DNA-directed RNA polymerase subunit RPC12/RpoP
MTHYPDEPTPRPSRTLAEMAADAAGGNGVACPKCGCRDLLAYKTEEQRTRTVRYRRCRHCGHKVLTKQAPEEIVRDVEGRNGDKEKATLRVLRAG